MRAAVAEKATTAEVAEKATTAEDRISGLPQHIIHHILSFVPKIQQVARISILSKQWRKIWRSFPVGDFKPWLILPPYAWQELRFNNDGQADELTQRFFRFVDAVMARPCDAMPKCELFVPEGLLPHVHRWIDIALEGRVRELVLYVAFRFSMEEYRYPIPPRILSGKFIRSLSLHVGIEIDGITDVSLPSLRSLELMYCRINDEMFARLVDGSPLLEEIHLQCCRNLSEIDLSSLRCVKKSNVIVDNKAFKLLKTNAPVVMLDWVHSTPRFEPEVFTGLTIDLSPNITCLDVKHVDKPEQWYHRLLSKLPLLESLVIDDCATLTSIVISNPLLMKISIVNCNHLLSLGIDVPNLQYFSYEAFLCDSLPDIWTTNAPYCCLAGFIMGFLVPPGHHWYQKFKRFLNGWSATFECRESYLCMCKDMEIHSLLSEQLNSSVPGALHADITFETYDVVYYLILDSILTICQPWYVYLRAPHCLLKTISVDFTNKEAEPGWVRDFGTFKFVFCYGVKVAGVNWIGGVEQEEPDWQTLYSLPRGKFTSVEVGFGLQW